MTPRDSDRSHPLREPCVSYAIVNKTVHTVLSQVCGFFGDFAVEWQERMGYDGSRDLGRLRNIHGAPVR